MALVTDAQQPGERIVRDALYWLEHLDDLRAVLSDRVDGDVNPPGQTSHVQVPVIAIRSPSFWVAEPLALREALVTAAFEHAARVPVPGQAAEKRLTLTVEAAAEVLGISRAFAYEAVRRGHIQCPAPRPPPRRTGRTPPPPATALLDRIRSTKSS